MKLKSTLASRYADLLPETPDETLNKLVQELDDMYTAPQRPEGLSWAGASQHRPVLVSVSAPNTETPVEAQPVHLRAKGRRKKAFLALAAAILVTFLGAGLVSTLLWQSHQVAPGTPALNAQADALLLAQLLRSEARPTIQQLVQSNQFTVHQTQRVNSDTVTLQSVLADANNVVLAYTIDGKSSLLLNSRKPTVTISGGQALDPLLVDEKASSTSWTPQDGPINEPVLHPPIAALAYFAPDSIQGNPQQVNLQIAIPVGETTAHFHVTVPFYAGKTISINQSVTSNGYTLALERAVITPSGTRFYYTTAGRRPFSGNTPLLPVWTLSIAGKTYHADSGNLGKPLPSSQNEINFWDTLQNQTGTWILRMQAIPEENIQGIWQVTFTVS